MFSIRSSTWEHLPKMSFIVMIVILLDPVFRHGVTYKSFRHMSQQHLKLFFFQFFSIAILRGGGSHPSTSGPRWRGPLDRHMVPSHRGKCPPMARGNLTVVRWPSCTSTGERQGMSGGHRASFVSCPLWRGHTPSKYKSNTPPCALFPKTLQLSILAVGENWWSPHLQQSPLLIGRMSAPVHDAPVYPSRMDL